MAVKPLTELRNGLLSSEACIQAPVFLDQSASRAERVPHPVPTLDSLKQLCLFPLIHRVDVY